MVHDDQPGLDIKWISSTPSDIPDGAKIMGYWGGVPYYVAGGVTVGGYSPINGYAEIVIQDEPAISVTWEILVARPGKMESVLASELGFQISASWCTKAQ